MPSPGDKKFLGGYFRFLGWFAVKYIQLCIVLLLALMVADLVFPQLRVYSRIHDTLAPIVTPPPTAAKP